MGGICSRASSADQSTGVKVSHRNDHVMMNHPDGIPFQNRSPLSKMQYNERASEALGNSGKTLRDPFAFPETSDGGISQFEEEPSEPQLTRSLSQRSKIRTKSATAAKIGASKVSEVGSLLGRAGTVGLGKAVEVLDTLGSSMTNLNKNSGFASGATSKGNKISILSFEVANTIVRGANLMQSLSKENVKYLKEVVLRSEGVERLISSDMNELLRLAAADKREELSIFAGEVMRFGNRCKDPQWHNLGRYFERLGSELTQRQLKEEVDTIMQQLMTLVQQTAELYHEMHALDRFDQDYRRKQQEEVNPNAVLRGDSLAILKSELKSQKKHVRNLKKKSLWSRILEEVMAKLVDIVHFLHLEIREAFESGGSLVAEKIESTKNRQRLGSAGLALHYANIITQIDTLVARPTSIPPNTRDTLYQGLPPNVKSALRPKLQSFHVSEELTVPQIKAEMEKTLQWLVPIATNTTKAHHGFGWVGEWANTGSEVNRKPSGQADLTRMETLYHADKEKTEDYILELVVWLHHLVSHAKTGLHPGVRSPIKSPIRSTNQKMSPALLPESNKWEKSITLSQEDHDMLRQVTSRKLTPGISKSQEFDSANKKSKRFYRLTKSSSHSPSSGNKKEFLPPPRRHPPFHLFDFNIDKLKALDLIDRVDNIALDRTGPSYASTRLLRSK